MAGEPIGLGEEISPKEGNSILITRSLNGAEVRTPLWITQFSTDLNLQIDSAQVRKGLVHRPVRFAERSLTFTTIWNVADRPKYLKLGETIRAHWAYNLNEDRPTPMVFKYFGASKTWKGFIENWETAFALTDVVLAYNFNMRIITTPDRNQPAESRRVPKTGIPYAPTAGQAGDYGAEWQTGKYFETGVQRNTKDKNTKTKGSKAGGGKSSRRTGGSPSSVVTGSTDNGADSSGASAGDQFNYPYWRITYQHETGANWYNIYSPSSNTKTGNNKSSKANNSSGNSNIPRQGNK